MAQFDEIASQAHQSILRCDDIRELEDLRVKYLGKKGIITEHLKGLSDLPHNQRIELGKSLNLIKKDLLVTIAQRKGKLTASTLKEKLSNEKLDITAPGNKQGVGNLHPITQVMDEVKELFARIGFEIKEGPEVENDFHNFEALNIPPNHPARAMHDTFYLNDDDDSLLRTHTSPVQIRVMKDTPPPIRIIAPGRVYRRDFDPTHSPMFHQIEGLVIDDIEKVSFAHLKGTVIAFLKAFFEYNHLEVRFRPSYFPFTEPSAEIDIRRDKNSKWLEVMGCGMVHPNVLKASKIDTERYAGYAFGLGVERLAMIKYGITDLRIFFENHLGVISQFCK